MARVVVRREVIDEGELSLVPEAKLREAFRGLESQPQRGKPLRRALAGCRSIRVGGSENRLVYTIDGDVVEVIAIGRRRDDEVYEEAARRLERG